MSVDYPQSLPNLFVPDWTKVKSGERVSLVIRDIVWEANVAVGLVLPSDHAVRLSGLLPPDACTRSKVTVLQASFLASSSRSLGGGFPVQLG